MAETSVVTEAASPVTEEIPFDEMSLEQLDQLQGEAGIKLDGSGSGSGGDEPPAEPPVSGVEPEPEQEPESSASKSEPEAPSASKPPEPNSEQEPEKEGARPPQFRIRPNDFREAEVMRLMKEGKSLREAALEVYGSLQTETPESQPAKSEPEPDPIAEYDQKIEEIQAQVKDLMAQRKAAREELENEKADDLTDQINDLKREADRLEIRKDLMLEARRASAREARMQKAIADKEAVVERYPTLGDPNHEDRRRFDQWLQEKSADPDYEAVFQSPRWRQILAAQFAAEAGIQATAGGRKDTATQKPTTPAKPAPVPKASAATVLRKPGNPPDSSFEASPEMLERDLEKMTPEQIERLLGEAERIRSRTRR